MVLSLAMRLNIFSQQLVCTIAAIPCLVRKKIFSTHLFWGQNKFLEYPVLKLWLVTSIRHPLKKEQSPWREGNLWIFALGSVKLLSAQMADGTGFCSSWDPWIWTLSGKQWCFFCLNSFGEKGKGKEYYFPKLPEDFSLPVWGLALKRKWITKQKPDENPFNFQLASNATQEPWHLSALLLSNS